MRLGKGKGSGMLWIVGFCVAGSVFVLGAPAFGQQVRTVNETLRLKTHPVKLDPQWGAGVARIGEGRFHQLDVTLIEIPPGKSLPPHRHLAEEMIFIVSGKGYTEMWPRGDGREKKEKYEWTEGDLLSPTLNAWHQHVNASPNTPARLVAVSTAPLTQNIFHDASVLGSVEQVFEDRWKFSVAQKPQYVGHATEGPETVRMQIGHLLPNLRNREMKDRGEGMLGITITPEGDMAGNRLLEMEVREFKTGTSTSPEHRHVWETVYFILKGEGYATLQREGESERRLDWSEGDLFLVEANEYHNHRPRGAPGGRFLQIKPSGYFRRVGLNENEFLMQNKPGTNVRLR